MADTLWRISATTAATGETCFLGMVDLADIAFVSPTEHRTPQHFNILLKSGGKQQIAVLGVTQTLFNAAYEALLNAWERYKRLCVPTFTMHYGGTIRVKDVRKVGSIRSHDDSFEIYLVGESNEKPLKYFNADDTALKAAWQELTDKMAVQSA